VGRGVYGSWISLMGSPAANTTLCAQGRRGVNVLPRLLSLQLTHAAWAGC
jgi:hypothetical protein